MTAQPQNPLLQKLQQAFTVHDPASPSALGTPTAKPVAPSKPTAQPDPTVVADNQHALDVFDEVLAEVESIADSVPEAPAQPSDVITQSTPVVAQQLVRDGFTAPFEEDPLEPSVLDQALPQAVYAATDTLNNPALVRPGAAETPQTATEVASEGVGVAASVESAPAGQVEVEKQPETPLEVESYLQKVDAHKDTQKHDVVIADGSSEQSNVSYPSRPVIVLPIDEAIEKKARFKSPKHSIKWLVAWSHKIIKMFAGKVIYRGG